MLNEDKISDIYSKLNWGCYQDECYYARHYNTFDNPTCTRCGESFRSDAFVRLIKAWTEYSSHHVPSRDIRE